MHKYESEYAIVLNKTDQGGKRKSVLIRLFGYHLENI